MSVNFPLCRTSFHELSIIPSMNKRIMGLAAVDRKLENNQDHADVYVSLIRTSLRMRSI
jgi:hypothetical protein